VDGVIKPLGDGERILEDKHDVQLILLIRDACSRGKVAKGRGSQGGGAVIRR
jgi:hypothetical protein